jgi:hypothetical protein
MNCDNELNQIQSKPKVQWLPKKIILGLIISLSLINLACNKEDKTSVNDPDEYYVKYEVKSSTIYTGGKLNVNLNSERNQNTTIIINTRSSWETVIGPVKKGFNATLRVAKEGNSDNHLKLYVQISVSKNGSPFALKEIDGSDTPRNSTQINYTIGN